MLGPGDDDKVIVYAQGHYKTCSKYKPNKQPKPCSECGGKNGHHKKFCSKYESHKEPVACPECGTMYGHKKTCSNYTANNKVCEECGRLHGFHYKTCSKYT